MKKNHTYSQSTLFFRILAGGYLLYTAWDLREAIAENPLFIVAIVCFAIIGAVLVGHSGWKLYKKDYEGAPGIVQTESDTETESN